MEQDIYSIEDAILLCLRLFKLDKTNWVPKEELSKCVISRIPNLRGRDSSHFDLGIKSLRESGFIKIKEDKVALTANGAKVANGFKPLTTYEKWSLIAAWAGLSISLILLIKEFFLFSK